MFSIFVPFFLSSSATLLNFAGLQLKINLLKLPWYFLHVKRDKKEKKKNQSEDSPGGPMARTLSSQCRGLGLDPWSGN